MALRLTQSASSWLAVCAIVACSPILGIEEAFVDPTLSGTGGTAATSTGGRAGLHNAGGGDKTTGGSIGIAGTASTAGLTGAAGASNIASNTLCNEYCDKIMANCATEALLQYANVEQCRKICALFPVGELGQSGNTIACRLRRATVADGVGLAERAPYCREAGPSGDDLCGTPCESFCTLMQEICTEESTGLYHYPNLASCMADCAATPPASFGYLDQQNAKEGVDLDNVACRIFHVISSATYEELATEHCTHAIGASYCVPAN